MKVGCVVSAIPTSGRGIKIDNFFIQNVVFLEERKFRYKIVGSPISMAEISTMVESWDSGNL
jgi:hypothetical protein